MMFNLFRRRTNRKPISKDIGPLVDESLFRETAQWEGAKEDIRKSENRLRSIDELLELSPTLHGNEFATPIDPQDKHDIEQWLSYAASAGLGGTAGVMGLFGQLCSDDRVAVHALHARGYSPQTIIPRVVEVLRADRRNTGEKLEELQLQRRSTEEVIAQKELDRRALRASESSVRLTKANIWLTAIIIFLTTISPVLIASFRPEIVK